MDIVSALVVKVIVILQPQDMPLAEPIWWANTRIHPGGWFYIQYNVIS